MAVEPPARDRPRPAHATCGSGTSNGTSLCLLRPPTQPSLCVEVVSLVDGPAEQCPVQMRVPEDQLLLRQCSYAIYFTRSPVTVVWPSVSGELVRGVRHLTGFRDRSFSTVGPFSRLTLL